MIDCWPGRLLARDSDGTGNDFVGIDRVEDGMFEHLVVPLAIGVGAAKSSDFGKGA